MKAGDFLRIEISDPYPYLDGEVAQYVSAGNNGFHRVRVLSSGNIIYLLGDEMKPLVDPVTATELIEEILEKARCGFVPGGTLASLQEALDAAGR